MQIGLLQKLNYKVQAPHWGTLSPYPSLQKRTMAPARRVFSNPHPQTPGEGGKAGQSETEGGPGSSADKARLAGAGILSCLLCAQVLRLLDGVLVQHPAWSLSFAPLHPCQQVCPFQSTDSPCPPWPVPSFEV